MYNKYILTYCSNIFKNDNVRDLFQNINEYKKNIKTHKHISICLSNNIIKEIKKQNNIQKIITWNKINEVEIKLINGFVYKNFHQKKIKENIYYPDWTKKERLYFTKNITFFAQKICKSKIFGITSLPISYNLWIKKEKKYNLIKATNYLFDLLVIFFKINKYKKIKLHLDIEPEPFCLMESCDDLILFFENWLIPSLKEKMKKAFLISDKTAKKLILTYFNLCFDMCHSAVIFENPVMSLKRIRQNKIKIGRVQVSSALKIENLNQNYKSDLKFLKKSPFLHQSIVKLENEKLIKYLDFKNLTISNDLKIKEIRVHCHIPIHVKKIKKNILTTQKELISLLKDIIKNNDTKNFEIETYTYNTIYKKYNKIKAIKKEYTWLEILIKKIYENIF